MSRYWYIGFGSALAGLAIGIAFFRLPDWACGPIRYELLPAYLQAAGVLFALFIAVKAPKWNSDYLARQEHERIKGLLSAIARDAEKQAGNASFWLRDDPLTSSRLNTYAMDFSHLYDACRGLPVGQLKTGEQATAFLQLSRLIFTCYVDCMDIATGDKKELNADDMRSVLAKCRVLYEAAKQLAKVA